MSSNQSKKRQPRNFNNTSTTGTGISPQSRPESKSHPSELHEVSLLLQLLFHRNKNQHRNQKWWKWLAMLRRSVRKLLIFEGHGKKGWKRSREEQREEKEKQDLERWVREVAVPEGGLAFSTVVADTQFAALGVVLVAVLARVGRIVGLPEPKLEPGLSVETKMGARTLLTSAIGGIGEESGEVVPRPNGEDMGKAVQRNADQGEEVATEIVGIDIRREESNAKNQTLQRDINLAGRKEPQAQEGKVRTAVRDVGGNNPLGRPRKRRKKGNAIDDLFGDLD